MDIAKSYDFFKPESLDGRRIHIIGCGAIGSTLAENLARYGITNMTLYDMDTVTSHNVANQMFRAADIGKPKTEALADILRAINPEIDEGGLRLISDGWHGQRLGGYVFLCVDNIDLRRTIATANKDNPFIEAMFDFRMGLTDAQHYAADWHDSAMVSNFIASMQYTQEEGERQTPVSACNLTLSVCSAPRMIVALGVANFINFVKGKGIKKLICCDAFDFILQAF